MVRFKGPITGRSVDVTIGRKGDHGTVENCLERDRSHRTGRSPIGEVRARIRHPAKTVDRFGAHLLGGVVPCLGDSWTKGHLQ
ncbi:hypothetical protein Q1695_010443 [Nippostrongylus brasiliensis]|nr:hypothetical protein Q1695_010443 [Nippostrongylus brasiliensis]